VEQFGEQVFPLSANDLQLVAAQRSLQAGVQAFDLTSAADVGVNHLASSCGVVHARPLDDLLLGGSAQLDARFAQDAVDDRSAGAVALCEREDAVTGRVSGADQGGLVFR